MEKKDGSELGIIPKYLKQIASLKITVICLLFLVVLVFWGTVYQADHGLYQAQQKFFYSWFFLAFGFIPLPGTVLIMFILTLNLISSLFFRIGFRLKNIGNFITHLGLIILFLGGGLTFFFSVESSMILREGETKNRTTSRDLWEFAVWEQSEDKNIVYAIDSTSLINEKKTNFSDLGINISIIDHFSNCSPSFRKTGEISTFSNSSGIGTLNGLSPAKEGNENIAGVTLSINGKNSTDKKILLFGKDRNPTQIMLNGKNFNFILRKKQYHLPIHIKLKDFAIKRYPNSQIVKSFESMVEVKDKKGMKRDVKISMNKPLRYEDLTFFQAQYNITPDGTEYSILSVVKNSGRLLPYISSIFVFVGLTIHFIMMLYRRKKKVSVEKEK